jgi:AraC-like DNA-binding protein
MQGVVFMDVIFLVAGSLAFLISLITAFRASKNNLPANYFLVFFVLVLFCGFVLKLANKTELDMLYPHILKLNYPLGLLRPTFFFLFVYYFTNPGKNFEGKMLIHFIPFLIVSTYFLPYYLLPADSKIELAPSIRWTVPAWYAIFGILYSTFYFLLSLRQFLYFREFRNKLDLARYRKIRSWIATLLGGYLLFIFFVLLNWLFNNYAFLEYYPFLLLSLMLIIISARMFCFPDVLAEEKKKERSSLQDVPVENRAAFLKKIKSVIESERLYKQDDLRLITVSEKTGIPESVISALINEMEGMPFASLINKYRIDSAKKMLKDPHYAHFTIEGIGYEVGFHSRASFFSAFKKETNLSPAEFKRSL